MRTVDTGLGDRTITEAQLDPGAAAASRIEAQAGAGDTGAFLDDRRPEAIAVELVGGEAALELEPAAVVLDAQQALLLFAREANQDVAGPAVVPDVDQRFLHDANDLDRGGRSQCRAGRAP